jgi:hypothetical protein
MARNPKLRTCTTMIYAASGQESHYAVLRGRMKGRRVFDAHSAEIVATYQVTGMPDYRAMTAKHATPEAPAVYWQV